MASAQDNIMIVYESLTQLHTKVGALHEKVDGIRVELLGNGQPGRIQRIEEDIKKNEKSLSNLKKKFWYSYGFTTGILALITYVLRIIGFKH